MPPIKTLMGRWRFGARSPHHSPMDSSSSPHVVQPAHSLISPGRESTGEITNNTVPLENIVSGNCCSALFKNLVRASGSSRWGRSRGPQTMGFSLERVSGTQESLLLLSLTPPCSF